jgi:PAS domain S-box-containing protein
VAERSERRRAPLGRGVPGPRRTWLAFAAVAVAYIASAKVGLELSVAHGVITPVWPPTGIALAALLLFGPRLWPAVALGAFISNATSGVSAEVAAAIAVGNTLEAVAGAYLLRRVGFRTSLDRARDVIALVVLGAFVSTTVSATNGVAVLAIAGSPAASPLDSAWVLWWLGDAMGDVLVAPLVLVWATRPPRGLGRARSVEGAAVLGLLAGAGAAVFLGGLWRYPYLLFPLLVWATLRFRQLGAATGSFVLAAVGVAGVVSGLTPLGEDPTTDVQVFQGLLAFIAVSLLVVGATLSERVRAEKALQQANESLAEAQALAHLGSWEWDIPSGRVAWSSELYRIFGLAPDGTAVTYDAFLRRVHPQDRRRVRREIERALEERSSFELTHRIVLDDGSERAVHGRGRVVVDAEGTPVRMLGTAQDVTERRRLEEVRENILVAVSHELRTPLTSIVGFAITLRERGGELNDGDRRAIVAHLAEQALRLERLLSDLLDLDRLRHGRVRVTLEPTDVGALVARVVAAQPRDGHAIELDAEPVVADVDPPKLERIVDNLVGNAIKHTPAGTKIAVSVEREGHDVLIRVDDGGPGVPAARRAEVFELFSRGAVSDGSVPGAGVGLALVAQFAALQGGRAWVEENEAGGASFRVRLPVSRADERALLR